MVFPMILEAKDAEMLAYNNAKGFAQKIEWALKELQQVQRSFEAQMRKKFQKYGNEKCFLLNSQEA